MIHETFKNPINFLFQHAFRPLILLSGWDDNLICPSRQVAVAFLFPRAKLFQQQLLRRGPLLGILFQTASVTDRLVGTSIPFLDKSGKFRGEPLIAGYTGGRLFFNVPQQIQYAIQWRLVRRWEREPRERELKQRQSQ